MKRYDTYKDSGIEWIGEIPNHWNSMMIKRLSSVKRGASPRPIDDIKYFDEEGEYAWVRIADVSASDRYLMNTTQTLSELGASLSVKREPGDFFLSIAGTVGKPIITKIKCCIHDGFVYLPDLKMNPEFLYYIFSTGLPYQGLGKWGTQLNLNTETVGEIVIPIPSEVEAIISYLDQKTNEIDVLIGSKKRLLELYEEEKIVIISQAVTKGIDPKAKMKDSGIEWIGETPEHWEVKKLKYVASINDESLTETTDKNFELEYIEISNVKSGIGIIETNTYLFKDAPSRARRIIKDGDVIVSTVRTYLKSIAKISTPSRNLIASTGFAVIRPRKLVSDYLGYLFYSEFLIGEIISLSTGVSYPAINASQIGDIFIPIPSKKEQDYIVQYIDTEYKRIDSQIVKTKRLIELLTEYRTALINEVITGKIKVID